MKKTFRVDVHERHISTYEVEAESAEEAQDLVARGEGTFLDNCTEFVEFIGNRRDWTTVEA